MVSVAGVSQAQLAGTYDYVATNFFIDTAANILEYIETIVHVLKDDGV